jgi:hypothetical protein
MKVVMLIKRNCINKAYGIRSGNPLALSIGYLIQKYVTTFRLSLSLSLSLSLLSPVSKERLRFAKLFAAQTRRVCDFLY